jgi:hypothetical protein
MQPLHVILPYLYICLNVYVGVDMCVRVFNGCATGQAIIRQILAE